MPSILTFISCLTMIFVPARERFCLQWEAVVWTCLGAAVRWPSTVNPFTPKSDQFQISPAGSPEILHHARSKQLRFSSLTQMKDDYTTNSHYLTYTFLRGWENVLLELGSERVRRCHLPLNNTICPSLPSTNAAWWCGQNLVPRLFQRAWERGWCGQSARL